MNTGEYIDLCKLGTDLKQDVTNIQGSISQWKISLKLILFDIKVGFEIKNENANQNSE